MREDLRWLIEVQKIDDEIAAERADQDSLQTALIEKKKSLERIESGLEARRDSVQELKKEVDRKNLDIKDKEASAEKDRATLIQVTSNKEYKAILTQIGKTKADLAVVEDEVLEAMGRVEEVEEKIEAAETAIREQKSALADSETEVKNRVHASNKRVADLEHRKEGFVVRVDSKLLQQYRRFANHGDGKAVVSSAGNMCGGCNMKLTAQKVSELMQGSEIVTCPTCGRMLYLNDERQEE